MTQIGQAARLTSAHAELAVAAFRLKAMSRRFLRRVLGARGYDSLGASRWRLRQHWQAFSSRLTRHWWQRRHWGRVGVRPPITEDLAAWSAAHGLGRAVLSPARTITRSAPNALGSLAPDAFSRRTVVEVAERYLVALPGACVWGANGLVILADGSIAAESTYSRGWLERDPGYSQSAPRRRVKKIGDYFSLLGPFSNTGNYGHWIHDAVLRLHGVEAHLPATVKYLVPPDLPDFGRETLHLLGISDEQLVPFSGDRAWECETLWFASLPPSGGEVVEAVQWLRQKVWAAAGVPATELRRRLYISREGTKWATLVNERELVPVLEKHGFEVVHCEGLSVKEQVRLFAQAAAIAAPTGSGQMNALFASNRTKVFQIVEPLAAEERFPVFWVLSETLGQPFYYLMGETVHNVAFPQYADVYVSPAELDRALQEFIEILPASVPKAASAFE